MFCKTCKSPILIKIDGIKILTSFRFRSNTSITPSMGILRMNDSVPALYCDQCKTEKKPDDIILLCSECGQEFPATEMSRTVETGGFFCNKCIKSRGISNTINMGIQLSKINIER